MVQIISFVCQPLKNGCHFNALKLSLTYSNFNEKLPKSVVIRTLRLDEKLLEQLVIHLQKPAVLNDYDSNKLHSYIVEMNFYKFYSNDVRGLTPPKIYYLDENLLQKPFKMIMEDLSCYDDGQPLGFCFDDSMLCLKQLALFHIANWNGQVLKQEAHLWDVGGYWTDGKEVYKYMPVRRTISRSFFS